MAAKIPQEEVKRVTKGVALLNKTKPGWTEKINGPKFGMEHVDSCVLFWVFDSYDKGLAKLKLSHTEGAAYGFSSDSPLGFFMPWEKRGKLKRNELMNLMKLWRKAINHGRQDNIER